VFVGGLLNDIRQILLRPTPFATGFFRHRLSNDVSQILRGAILVVMATKFEIIAYKTRFVYYETKQANINVKMEKCKKINVKNLPV